MRPAGATARAAAALLAILVAGCSFGRGDGPRWPDPPRGVRVSLEFDRTALVRLAGETGLSNGVVRGELLNVRPDGLLLRVELVSTGLNWADESRILLLERPVIALGELREQGDRPDRQGRRLDLSEAVDLDFLTRWARYPYPMTDEQLAAFVEGSGEPAVIRVSLPPRSDPNTGPTAPPESREAFLERARAAAERFHDRRVAVREGYRLLGPDFPGMGEHWVHPGRAVSGQVVAERPPVLSYVTVDGAPVLTGVAWTVPLVPGEAPPRTPLGDDVWHDHSGTLDEEALLLDSPRTHEHGAEETSEAGAHASGASETASPRLSMVHAWLWTPNPDGILAQNNWSLPYLKAGLAPAEGVDPAVARALSLGGSGVEYYRTLLVRAAGARGDDRAIIAEVVSRAARRADTVVAEACAAPPPGTTPGAVPLSSEDGARLVAVWDGLWRTLEHDLSSEAWERLRPAAAVWRNPPATAHGSATAH